VDVTGYIHTDIENKLYNTFTCQMNSDKKETQIMRTAEQENKETLTADILPTTLQENFLTNG